jgi:N-acyl-D-amino-acid deacylase
MTRPTRFPPRTIHERTVAWLSVIATTTITLAVVATRTSLQAAPVGATGVQPISVDLLIAGGRVVDGTGSAPRTTDVGVRGDRIVFVGNATAGRVQAARTIDAKGLVVAPGFIDPHAHVMGELGKTPAGHLDEYLMQGVTTVLTGNDGQGPTNIAAAFMRWRTAGMGPNAGLYIGQGSVRGRVVGARDVPATPQQVDSMRALVRHAMQDGAIGLSSGLFYAPGSFATTDEVIAIAKELKPFGGVYDTHQRDESSYEIGLLASTREAMRIAKEAGIALNISHIKALGVDVWGRSDSLIAMIRKARAAGDAVWADQYPYTASGTSVEAALVPKWAEDGGTQALIARFDNDTLLPKLRRDMEENMRRRGGAASLLLTSGRDAAVRGKTLAQVAAAMKTDAISAAVAVIRNGGANVASFNMQQSDIDALAAEPWVMTGSDGSDGHPRKYGTFPRKLREFVLDRHILTLEAMVHQSAAVPAQVFGLIDRGVLRTGAFADVIVFDTATVKDQSTYTAPTLLATGMRYVFVNGVAAVDGGTLVASTSGRVVCNRRACPQ